MLPGQATSRISTASVNGSRSISACARSTAGTCLALIEANTAWQPRLPVYFANARAGFHLTAEFEAMLDRFVELEGHPEVVQCSGR